MSDLAQGFIRQGHEVLVITTSEDLEADWSVKMTDGVRVLYLSGLNISSASYFGRAVYEFTLPFLMILSLLKSPFKNNKWDLVAWYSPTIFFGPLILYLKIKSSCRTYLILRDIFPEWAYDLRLIRKGFAYYFFKLMANLQYQIADTIGVQTESNLSYFSKWYKARGKRVEVLQNWQTPIQNDYCSIQVRDTILAGRKIFVYIGNMGIAQGMDIMINLAAHIISRDDIGFLFVGRGSEVGRLKSLASQLNLSNVLFFDEIGSDEMTSLLAQCHVGLLALDTRHRSHNIPGKFLTYLSAGLPVLARINPETDLLELIEGEAVGRAYVGESAKLFADMAASIVDDYAAYCEMALRGPQLARERFSTSRAVRQIIQSMD
jgi:glycosyltransferase involved in cell wall biosynthesis